MSRQANPRIIGGFVVGAIVLAVAAVLNFGSGEYFAVKRKFVMYFDGALSGLSAGSPVLFQGARIGSVIDVIVQFDTVKKEVQLPVYVELEQNTIQFVGGPLPAPGEGMRDLIDRGLRAQLVSQSMITGQLAILLDFFPDVPLRMVGGDPAVQEIPTAPSFREQLDDLFKKFKTLPINDLVADLRRAIQGVDELVRSPDIKKTIQDIDATVLEFKKLASHVDDKIDGLVSSFEDTSTQARQLMKNLDSKIDPLSTSFEDTLDVARGALKQARKTLATAETLIAEDSPTVYHLNDALVQLSSALRSIRDLANYLEQHPDALIQGKSMPGGK